MTEEELRYKYYKLLDDAVKLQKENDQLLRIIKSYEEWVPTRIKMDIHYER